MRLARSGSFELPVTLGALLPAAADVVSGLTRTTGLSFSTQLFRAVYDVGLMLAFGLGVDLVALGLRTAARGRALVVALLMWALSTPLVLGLLERNLARQADASFDGRFQGALFWLFTLGAAVTVPAAFAVGTWLGRRRRLFVVGLLLALGAAVVNVSVLRDDYFELHTAAAVLAAIVGGTSSRPALLRWLARRRSISSGRLGMAAAALAIGTLALPPSNAIRLALFASPGCAGAWLAALHVWSVAAPPAGSPLVTEERWVGARDGKRPPSRERLAGPAPVVVLLTIDATRADVLLDESRTAAWPAFTRLRREGVTFTLARSPGSQTSVSLTALFAGKYFSEMRWARHGKGKNRFEYAATDPSPRLAALLSDAGVSTFKVAPLVFLSNGYGVAPGFAEENVVTEGRRHARASEVIPPLVARLRKVGEDEPFFAFAHLTEPHSPYDRGPVRTGPQFERYVSEIGATDPYVGQLLSVLSSPNLASRAILIVTSDHGEAFGEHGTEQHTKTIYEELVRVPLFAWGAGVRSREIGEPVTLVDLYPTILDVFGLDTPDDTSGETLVPLLAGKELPRGRPILAEGRLRRALYSGGTKVIVDGRRKTIEGYDLDADPRELVNRYDEDPARFGPSLATLVAYFSAREHREPGYVTPYKP